MAYPLSPAQVLVWEIMLASGKDMVRATNERNSHQLSPHFRMQWTSLGVFKEALPDLSFFRLPWLKASRDASFQKISRWWRDTWFCPSYLFNPFYLLPGLMFLFCSRVIFEQYRIGDLTSGTRELRFSDHVVRRCSVQRFRKDVLWWSSRVKGGSILPRTILGHRCGDKRWSSGTTSSSPFLSLRNLNSHEWKWNSRKGKCRQLGVSFGGTLKCYSNVGYRPGPGRVPWRDMGSLTS